MSGLDCVQYRKDLFCGIFYLEETMALDKLSDWLANLESVHNKANDVGLTSYGEM